MIIDRLGGELSQGDQPEPVQWRTGTVSSTSPFKVKIGGSSVEVAARKHASYTATLNDHVMIQVRSGDVFVTGKIG